METAARIGFRVAISLGLLGYLFRVFHWPSGGLLLLFAGLILVMSAALDLARRKPITGLDGARLAVLALAAVVHVFRNLHWPGSNYALMAFVSAGAVYLSLGGFKDVTTARAEAHSREGWLTPVARYLTLALFGAQYLFRVQHWPFAFGLLLLGIASALVWVWSTMKRVPAPPLAMDILDQEIDVDEEL